MQQVEVEEGGVCDYMRVLGRPHKLVEAVAADVGAIHVDTAEGAEAGQEVRTKHNNYWVGEQAYGKRHRNKTCQRMYNLADK